MIGYIAAFAGGIAVGVGLLLAHQYSVRRAVNVEITKAKGRFNALTDENDRLRGRINELTRDHANNSGYKRGVEDGYQRGKNARNWEVLENTLSADGRRTVQVGGGAK